VAFPRYGIDVVPPLTANADPSHVELFVGRKAFCPVYRTAGENVEQDHARTGSAEELPAVDQVGFVLVHGVTGSLFPVPCRIQPRLRYASESKVMLKTNGNSPSWQAPSGDHVAGGAMGIQTRAVCHIRVVSAGP
jgi:hypothetical protein